MPSKHFFISHAAQASSPARLSGIACAVYLGLQGTALAQSTTATADVRTLGEVSVTAQAVDNSNSYQNPTTSTATRTEIPIKDIPQSISSITAQVIEDTADSGSIESALEYAGAGKGNNFLGSLSVYSVRGFSTSEFYRNGFAINTPQYGNASPDSASISSVDVMRGPSALSFGRGDPGGAFNIVSKKPQAKPEYSVGLTLDSEGARRLTLDASGALEASQRLLYRINAAVDNSDTFRDHVEKKRQYIAPSLSWQLTPDTLVMLDAEYSKVKTPLDRGIPYTSDSRTLFLGDPSTGDFETENALGQLRMEHQFSPDWRIEGGIQRMTGSAYGMALHPGNISTDGQTIVRSVFKRDNGWDNTVAQAFLHGKFHTVGIQHQLMLGTEWREEYVDTWQVNGGGYPLNLSNPVYGVAVADQAWSRAPYTDSKNRAFILQDQITITPRLRALLGLRHDDYEADTGNTIAGTSVKTDMSSTTPRLGLSYDITPATTAYMSYARSFKPNAGLSFYNTSFAPEEGTSWEGGLKFALFDAQLDVTTAIFHTERDNVLTPDPINDTFSIAAGQVRSQGFDVSLAGNITPQLRLTGYAGWVDAEVTRSSTGDTSLPVGARLANIPKVRASLMAMYNFGGELQGLSTGGGIQYVGERVSSSSTAAYTMGSYSTVDLMANYQLSRNITLRGAVRNVFDKHYLDRAWSNTIAYPGAPRSVQVSLMVKI